MHISDLDGVLKYSELAFKVCRQRIDDHYQQELSRARKELLAGGHTALSGAFEALDTRLKADKVHDLIIAKAVTLIESYEAHETSIDTVKIGKEVAAFANPTVASIASTYQSQAAQIASRTGRVDPTIHARSSEFRRVLERKSHAAMLEAEHYIMQKKLASQKAQRTTAVVHNEYHLSGPSPRVNVDSHDESVNLVQLDAGDIWEHLRTQISEAVPQGGEQLEMLRKLHDLEAAQGRNTFNAKLGDFMACAANWTKIIIPYIPALTEMAKKAIS